MGNHERNGESDEWYTPGWLFDAIGVRFDLDPCAAAGSPAESWCLDKQYARGGLEIDWRGSVWLNAPYGGRNGIRPWLQRLAEHGDGIALVPNRTGADWWQDFAQWADGMVFVRGKIRFLRPDGSEGVSPGYGNVLMAFGSRMAGALNASGVRGFRAF